MVELRYVRKQHQRKKYRCKCGCIETAIGPKKLIPGGRYSSRFAVEVAVSRYDDSLPLTRQVKAMKRAGLLVDSQTLWDQIWAAACHLRPAYDATREYLIGRDVLLADETRWPLLGVKRRKTKNWYVWAMAAQDAAYYRIQKDRSNDAGRTLLGGFRGTLMSDGYVVYSSLAKEFGFTLANDWCHVRRKFLEAEPTAPAAARPILDEIGKLFGVERELDKLIVGMIAEEAAQVRFDTRQARLKPIITEIGAKAYAVRGLKQSPIGKAVGYMERRWDNLQVYLHNGRVPISSNAIEAALRTPVLGRKNSLGSKSERGIEATAIFHTLITSARLNGLDPPAYLNLALDAAIRGDTVPLPHEVAVSQGS